MILKKKIIEKGTSFTRYFLGGGHSSCVRHCKLYLIACCKPSERDKYMWCGFQIYRTSHIKYRHYMYIVPRTKTYLEKENLKCFGNITCEFTIGDVC